jgi:hypothetical protein
LRLLSRLRSHGEPGAGVEAIDQGLRHAAWVPERSPTTIATMWPMLQGAFSGAAGGPLRS